MAIQLSSSAPSSIAITEKEAPSTTFWLLSTTTKKGNVKFFAAALALLFEELFDRARRTDLVCWCRAFALYSKEVLFACLLH